ncbi:hypothetical protein [Micromonospora sp. NBS 11-29]|uniref:hypothetical protein n=1 Tax=Micromonospora sp. NBS 11-29 TaxID=1960879 RepID=UPI0020CEAEC3|nr:hypothetical protein [Micromonospora sp. NBS 11-29]
MQHLAGPQVQPAEDQPLVLGVEHVPALGGVEDHRVPLDQRAEVTDPGQLVALPLGLGGGPAQFGQPGVHPVEVPLLGGDLLVQRALVGQRGAPVVGRHDGLIEGTGPRQPQRRGMPPTWPTSAPTLRRS